MIKHLKLLLLILTINWGLFGCFNSKKAECNKIIEISNQLAEVTQSNLNIEDTNKVLEIADKFDGTAQEILGKKIKDQQLAEYSKNLGIIYQKYGEFTRKFITAFEKKDTENAILSKENLINLSQEQEKVVKNINNYCQEN
jgi:hypothetical protein